VAQASAPERLGGLGLAGGAVYDGLIALTARAAGAELISLDRRAVATYHQCGAVARLLA
jgi:toxin FitB